MRAGLVVEADVAAGDRDAQRLAAVGQPAHRLGELPHHRRVLRRAEVQAVGHRQRPGAGGGHVAVGLGQRQLGPGVRIEPGVAAVAVDRDARCPRAGLPVSVEPDHAGVLGLGQHRVAQHVPVVLVGHPGLVGQVGDAISFSAVARSCVAVLRPGQAVAVLAVQRVLVVRAPDRPLVDRPLVGQRARRHVHDGLAVPAHHQPAGVGDGADHGRR